ncbi:MAG TPA: LysR family transcriptional regulator [Xanthobacteraceae bacterium]|jgi:DNA-binding transcriptional LysR family regulator|nr:LysR family transcriptional regulator [Xanthobacteraceae bacterium]
MGRPSLDHFQTFAHVIDLGSFSTAAQRLEISQPGVSLQVRQLERRHGIRLIERVGRRVTAIAAGEELPDYARRIDGVVMDALDAMTRHSKGTVGRVRLGTGATACIYFLPPILRSLRSGFPGLDIVVTAGNTSAILKSILSLGKLCQSRNTVSSFERAQGPRPFIPGASQCEVGHDPFS